jgi:hypothetical protein
MSVGIGTRSSPVEYYFTHIDDIGVAKTILDRRNYMSNISNKYDKWRLEILKGSKGGATRKVGKFLDDNSILEQIEQTAYFFIWWRGVLHAAPASWTYAPGQFYLTNWSR